MAASLLLSLGHNPGLGGHNSRLGSTSSDLGGHGPDMFSRGTGPVTAYLAIIFEVSDPKLRSDYRSIKNYCLTLLSIPISRSNFIFCI